MRFRAFAKDPPLPGVQNGSRQRLACSRRFQPAPLPGFQRFTANFQGNVLQSGAHARLGVVGGNSRSSRKAPEDWRSPRPRGIRQIPHISRRILLIPFLLRRCPEPAPASRPLLIRSQAGEESRHMLRNQLGRPWSKWTALDFVSTFGVARLGWQVAGCAVAVRHDECARKR